MLRLVLLLIIGYLIYRGVRSLIPGREPVRDERAEGITDLRACSGCGTFVERAHLDDSLRCRACRSTDGGD